MVFSQHSSSCLWGRDTRRFPERQAEHLRAVTTSARRPAQAQAGAAPVRAGKARAAPCQLVGSGCVAPAERQPAPGAFPGEPSLLQPGITVSEALLRLRTCAVRLSSVGTLVREDCGDPCTRWQRGGGMRVLEGARSPCVPVFISPSVYGVPCSPGLQPLLYHSWSCDPPQR